MEKILKEFKLYHTANSEEFEEFRKALIRELEDCKGYEDLIKFSNILIQSILNPLRELWKQ